MESSAVEADVGTALDTPVSTMSPELVASHQHLEEMLGPDAGGNNADVEKFDGKIVYNPDGSAYIIEGDDALDVDNPVVPLKQDSIIETPEKDKDAVAYPKIASAFFVSRNPFYQALSQGYFRLLNNDKNKVTDAPVVHSYRVYTLRDLNNDTCSPTGDDKPEESAGEKAFPEADFAVPIKPILMCFMCKLSFGYVKSFVTHAMSEHKLSLNAEEKEQLSRKNTSAVIQCVGKDRGPLLSFLEPVAPSNSTSTSNNNRNDSGTPSEGSHSPANSVQLPTGSVSPSTSTPEEKRGVIQVTCRVSSSFRFGLQTISIERS